jgi:hypothetical protein
VISKDSSVRFLNENETKISLDKFPTDA